MIERHNYLFHFSFLRFPKCNIISLCAPFYFPFSFFIPNTCILIILTKYINWFHRVPEGMLIVYSLGHPLMQFSLVNKHSSTNQLSQSQCIYTWFSLWFSIHFFFHLVLLIFPSNTFYATNSI